MNLDVVVLQQAGVTLTPPVMHVWLGCTRLLGCLPEKEVMQEAVSPPTGGHVTTYRGPKAPYFGEIGPHYIDHTQW